MRITQHDLPITQSLMDVEGRFLVQFSPSIVCTVIRIKAGQKTQYDMMLDCPRTYKGKIKPWRGWRLCRSLEDVNAILAELIE